MTYFVKEMYYTLQGEGFHTGRPAVFCRFSGCNLWSGLEKDRATATCNFCDTDFTGTDGPGGGMFLTAEELSERILTLWPGNLKEHPFLVCTGGEPLLQLDSGLIATLHARRVEIAVETNGTLPAPSGLDWICVSPKADTRLEQTHGDELKLVFPQPGVDPQTFETLDFSYFFLQPMDGPHRDQNTRLSLEYCREHPRWRLSLQTHKFLGIP